MPERFRLRPVPAGPHVAPASARSPAPIEKQPRAAAALAKLPDVATAQKSVELQREGVLAKKVTRMRLDLPHRFDHAGRTVRWGRMGSGPAIVLVHGTPFSSQVWRRIAPYLASRRTVYWFDLLGYGQSAMAPDGDVSLGVQNGLLAALVREWELDAPEVLAHDFGGATALRAYHLDGLRYSALTLVDPVALSPWGSPFVAHVRAHEPAFAGLPDYAHDALLRAYLQGAAFVPLTEAALSIHMAPWRGEIGQAGFYRQIAQMDRRWTDEIEPLYAPMECPVTLLWGERDAWISIERGRDLAARLTNEQLTEVPECGHLMQEDAPEAIVAAVLSPAV